MTQDLNACAGSIGQSAEIAARVRAIQHPFLKCAVDFFSDAQKDHLRTLVRLAVEFRYYLDLPCTHQVCRLYVSESIFSGIDSYSSLVPSYRSSFGTVPSSIEWAPVTQQWITAEFKSLFEELNADHNFARRCRILFDLFRLQILFAALAYE